MHPGTSKRLTRISRLLAAAVLVSMGIGTGTASAQPLSPASESLRFLTAEVDAYAAPLGPFIAGNWHTLSTICWACNQGGPATAAATAYMLGGRTRPELLQEAQETIDTAIATRQQPSGAFVGPLGDTQSPDVATFFFG